VVSNVFDTTGAGFTAVLILLAISITVYEVWSRRQRALA